MLRGLALSVVVLAACETKPRGGCQDPCPDRWEPVCGADDRTYANACEAACADQTYVPGECEDGCTLGEPALLHATGGNSATVDAVRTPSGTLLVWEEIDTTSTRLFSLALDPSGLAISGPHLVQTLDGSPAQPQVVHVKEDVFAVAWLQGTNPSACGPLGLRLIDGGGVPLEEPVLAPSSTSLACQAPTLAWTGASIVVIANEEDQEDLLQTSAYLYDLDEGFAEEPIPLGQPAAVENVRAAWSNTRAELLLTRLEHGATGTEAHLLRTDAKGTVLSDLALFSARARYVEPAILPDGREFVLWDAEDGNTAPRLFLGFLIETGLAATFEFSDGEVGRTDDVSHLAVGEGGFAAAWSDDRDGVQRVFVNVSDFDGNRLTDDLPISAGEGGIAIEPAVVPTRDGFAVIWRDTVDRPGGDLYVRSLDCRW